jgi:hypothetical protein
MVIAGRLTKNAHARQRPTDDPGHFAPTLCFEVESLNGLHHSLVEQFYPVGCDAECEAAAKKLLKGMVVTYEVPVTNIIQKHMGISHLREVQPEALPDLFPASATALAHA